MPENIVMKFEAVTIKDIAKALGLSTSTVSRALRDSYEISQETKKMVLDYATKINYQPNPIALSLKERRTYSIGIVVSEIANPFFSQIIDGIESVAYINGYTVIISTTHESYEREKLNLTYLTSRSIDGLLVSIASETTDFGVFRELIQRGMPIVFFDRIARELPTHKVIVDNYRGVYKAVEHLLAMGYKRIGAIAGRASLALTKDRVEGFKAALKDYALLLRDGQVQYCPQGGLLLSEVEEAVNRLFATDEPPDAIIALADKLTTATLQVLKTQERKLPDEVGLIGFSNASLTELLNPSLSVIQQPAFEMGKTAISLLLQLIESKNPVTTFETKVLDTGLVIRDSTRRQP